MNLPVWRRRQDEELQEELATHLRMAIADRVARGGDPEEAARAARLEFGNVNEVAQGRKAERLECRKDSKVGRR
jgi:hypothetical protein